MVLRSPARFLIGTFGIGLAIGGCTAITPEDPGASDAVRRAGAKERARSTRQGQPGPSDGGSDLDPGSHAVSLAWDPSPTLGVTYNLYRADTSGGPYAAVATGLAATVATDTSVTSGATYYYVVRAEGPGGESSASNEIQAVIP